MFDARKIVYITLDSVDSTNDWLRREYKKLDLTRLTCLTANMQTRGKGSKQERSWFSPAHLNLYCSFLFPLPSDHSTEFISLILSVSALKTCHLFSLEPTLKWPNDLLLKGKKLAGVLIETIQEEYQVAIIAGIGININMGEKELPFISQPATSFYLETGKQFCIDDITKKLAVQFTKDLNLFIKKGFVPFVDFFQNYKKE